MLEGWGGAGAANATLQQVAAEREPAVVKHCHRREYQIRPRPTTASAMPR